jgi:hypothetical protein
MPASWLARSIEGVEYAATLVRPPLDVGSAVQLARNQLLDGLWPVRLLLELYEARRANAQELKQLGAHHELGKCAHRRAVLDMRAL